jgi:hypothetical protein
LGGCPFKHSKPNPTMPKFGFFFFFGKKKCYFNEPYHKENVKYREKSESKIHDNPEEDYVTFVA